jgi:hypothetical protein
MLLEMVEGGTKINTKRVSSVKGIRFSIMAEKESGHRTL